MLFCRIKRTCWTVLHGFMQNHAGPKNMRKKNRRRTELNKKSVLKGELLIWKTKNQAKDQGTVHCPTQGFNLLQLKFLGNWTLDPPLKWAKISLFLFKFTSTCTDFKPFLPPKKRNFCCIGSPFCFCHDSWNITQTFPMSQPWPTSPPSTRCPLGLGCKWTSTELTSGFT